MENKQLLFLLTMMLIYLGYIVLFLGISYIDESYIDRLNFIVQLLIGGFIVYKFHPFSKHFVLEPFDKQLIFYAGFFLLLSTLSTILYQWIRIPIVQHVLQKKFHVTTSSS